MIAVPARAADLPGICSLLASEGLPYGDLTEQSLTHFLALREDDLLTGAVGLERYGDVALLRSLVVSAQHRRFGYGALLTDAIEKRAFAAGARSIYLLTTSAEFFFQARGYRRIERSQAPTAIQTTTQFSALCPSSAVLMVKP